jgi:NCAIR mutase (PurE)-related protein
MIEEILLKFKNSKINREEACEMIKNSLYHDIGHSVIDTNREERTGFPEAIFCQNKTPEQIIDILFVMKEKGMNIIATRLDAEKYKCVSKKHPEGNYFPESGILTIKNNPPPGRKGLIAIVCAGTSDFPVAEEAAITAEFSGFKIQRFYDVGVAGIHRLFSKIQMIKDADVIIAAAGMEGALVSVLGGLVKAPIIAVPVSVCYGSGFNGLSALLGMLNSCSSGISVVNIDNGFGAAMAACRICNLKKDDI